MLGMKSYSGINRVRAPDRWSHKRVYYVGRRQKTSLDEEPVDDLERKIVGVFRIHNEDEKVLSQNYLGRENYN